MLRNNPARDRQSQTRSALLGRKMRQEQALLVLRRNPLSTIRNLHLHRVAVALHARSHAHPPYPRPFHRLRSVINQIGQHAPQQLAIRLHQRQRRLEFRPYRHTLQPAVKQIQSARHNRIHILRRQARGREARKLRERIHQRLQGVHFALDQPRTLRHQFLQLGPQSRGLLRSGVALQITQQPLRRKLNRRQRILDLVRNPLRHFLPGRRLLRAQQIRQIVNHDHVARIRKPRSQRTHRHRRAHQPPRRGNLNFPRRHAHAQRTPHQMQHRSRRVFSHQVRQSPRLPRRISQNRRYRRIHLRHFARRVQRNHAGGNIFQNRFHQFPPPLTLFNGLFQTLREFINLAAPLAQLLRHAIERAHQHPQLVLPLHVNPVIKIAARNLPRRLRQRLNRYRHLLGQEQRHPRSRKSQNHGYDEQAQQHVAFISAQALFLPRVSFGLRANFRITRQEITRQDPRHVQSGSIQRSAPRNVQMILGVPDFRAVRQRLHQRRSNRLHLRHGLVARRVLGLHVRHAVVRLSRGMRDPGSVHRPGQSQQRLIALARRRGFFGNGIQVIQVGARHVFQQPLALLIGNFQRPREPGDQRAIHNRVAEEEKETDRQQRHANRAQHHFHLEARTHLPAAPLDPQAHQAARQNHGEHQQRHRQQRRQREKYRELAALLRTQRHVQRPHHEYGSRQQRDHDSADPRPQPIFSLVSLRLQRPSSGYLLSKHSP